MVKAHVRRFSCMVLITELNGLKYIWSFAFEVSVNFSNICTFGIKFIRCTFVIEIFFI